VRHEAVIASTMRRRRQPHRRDPHAARRHRQRSRFGDAGEVRGGHIRFGSEPARRDQREARCDQHRALAAFQLRAYRFDCAAVVLAILSEAGEVVVERGMDHGIRRAGAGAEAVEIIQRSAMDFRAQRGERCRAAVRTAEAQHLVPRADQLGSDGGADKAGRAGDEDTHGISSSVDVRCDISACFILLK
jgi:hypothetical protein